MFKVKIKRSSLIVKQTEALATGASKVYHVEFSFDDSWQGLTKSVIFRAGEKSVSVLLEGSSCVIPWEVLTQENVGKELLIGVSGWNDELVTLPTVWNVLEKIQQGAELGEYGLEPSPSVVSEIHKIAKNAEEKAGMAETLARSAKEAAEAVSSPISEELLADGTVNIVLGDANTDEGEDNTTEETNEPTDITDTLTWTENAYIEYGSGAFKTANGFRYSNIITLQKGEAIRVTASGSTPSNALISKWSGDGSTFLGCVYQAQGTAVETVEHTATETEYLRICYNKYFTTKDGGALVVETYQSNTDEGEDTSDLVECSQINGRNLVDKGARELVNPLFGKSICVDGDSITFGQGNKQTDGTYKGWADIIAEQNGMTVHKLAKSGATLISGSNSICDRVSTIPEADYIIISGGYNDYANDVEIGELTNQGFRIGTDTIDVFASKTLDKTKVIDAVEYIVRYLLTTYPTKKLGFVFTHKVGGEWHVPKGSGKTHTLKEYHDAIVSVLEKYSFPYCDLTQISRFNTGTPTYAAQFTNNGDAIHPNQSGYEIGYVPQISAWLKTL